MDKPAIQYVVEEAVESGMRDILIITGRGKRAIEDHFDRNVELEDYLRRFGKARDLEQMQKVGNLANIMYVRQREPLGLGHAVSCAERYVGGDSCAVLLGDDICIGEAPCTKQLASVFAARHASVIAVQKVPESKISSYGIISGKTVGEHLHRVEDIVEKPSPNEVHSNLATIGRYVFSPGIFKSLKSVKPGVGGEIQLTDAIRDLLLSEDVFAFEFGGRRYDIGDKASWLRANIELAMDRPEFMNELAGLFAKPPRRGRSQS